MLARDARDHGQPPDPRAAERVRTLKRCAEEGGYECEAIFEY